MNLLILGLGLFLMGVDRPASTVQRVIDDSKTPKQKNQRGLFLLALPKKGDVFATSSEDGQVSIHEKNGQVKATYGVHKFEQGFVVALAFDPGDYERLFVASDQGLFAWEWKTKAKLRKLFGNDPDPKGKQVFDSPVATLAIAPDGRHLALIEQGQRV